jgi:glycine/serine hydroxymethyltransferase
MDCEKLVAMTKRWGYTASHQYLIDIYGMTQKEAEECAKKVGIDLGYWALSREAVS